MIVSNDIQPEKTLYYLGAQLIRILKDQPGEVVDFFEAFEELKNAEGVSIASFQLVLDWLYLLNLLKAEKGAIVRCF